MHDLGDILNHEEIGGWGWVGKGEDEKRSSGEGKGQVYKLCSNI